jgi:hypothetical protein
MKVLHAIALGLAGWLLAASPAFADVKLTMGNGRVTLVAKDVTVRQILTEWARIGQTRIINLDRIPGGPVSMELNNMPEAQALDVLLRSVSGYLAAPRPVDAANLSHFDRIVVMPTSAAPRPPAGTTPAPPVFVQPLGIQQAPADDGDDDRPATNMPAFAPNRGPIFNTPQQPQVVNPQFGPNSVPFDPNSGAQGAGRGAAGQPAQFAPPGANQPAAPGIFPRGPTAGSGGVAVPGMIVPPPQAAPGTQPGTTPSGRQ